ncbi:MAG: imidazoleglycerol-phosphate dehydratase HisB [Planctomycetaceae bacterium]|nr:imidazoleglycerol-phosphate dehydratase HisB [Planctomycetaceae bacterium]
MTPTTHRIGKIERSTNETQIQLELNLDGTGRCDVQTGIGFFDHMLELFAKHGLFDLTLRAKGDLHVDQHHTVEDVGICLGQAILEAVGDKRGIHRYGHFTLPMDESLVTTAVDLAGRYGFVFHVKFPHATIGQFDSELVEHFWHSLASRSQCNFHAILHHGSNGHHISEAVFKSAARSFRQAVSFDPRQTGIPSTKGLLT